MTNAATLAARYARRPLLLEPGVAADLAGRLQALDDRAFSRPGRLQAFLRRVGLAGSADRPQAMEDDDDWNPVPIEQRLAYAPLWAGEAEDTGFCWSLVQGVALMNCDTPLVERGEEFCGVVYHGYDTLKAGIADAMADSRVQAVFLRLASPGGVVAGGLPELAAFMRTVRATGNAAGKPIWVYADMACSAAYWIAAQADRILSSNVGLVGSIGAVLVHQNFAGALQKEGVEITPIQFGEQKTAGAWWSALSPDARADLQAEIDQCGRNFVADVTVGRPQLTSAALIATQARVFMAQHDEKDRSGLALGFVDAICGEEEAFLALLAEISPPNSVPQPRGAVMAKTQHPFAAAIAGLETRIAAIAAVSAAALATAQANEGVLIGAKALARSAQLNVRQIELETRLTRLQAEAPEAGDDADDVNEDMADDEGEEDAAGAPKPQAKPAPPTASAPVRDEAALIAASAEAKTNPAQALSAIQAGLTLEQFQAMASAPAAGRGRSALADYMAQNPAKRVAPDTPTSKTSLFEVAVADAKAKAARAGQ